MSEGEVVGGDFTLARGAGDGTTNGYNADMREAVTAVSGFGTPPSAAVGVASAGPQTNTSEFAAFSRVTITLDSGGNALTSRDITISGLANDGSIGEVLSGVNFLLGDLYSTKMYYLDGNHPITVTVDELP